MLTKRDRCALDNGESRLVFCLTDKSKAFDCLHNPLFLNWLACSRHSDSRAQSSDMVGSEWIVREENEGKNEVRLFSPRQFFAPLYYLNAWNRLQIDEIASYRSLSQSEIWGCYQLLEGSGEGIPSRFLVWASSVERIPEWLNLQNLRTQTLYVYRRTSVEWNKSRRGDLFWMNNYLSQILGVSIFKVSAGVRAGRQYGAVQP